MNIYEHIGAICGCTVAILVVIWAIWGTISWIINDLTLWKSHRKGDLEEAYKKGFHAGEEKVLYEQRIGKVS